MKPRWHVVQRPFDGPEGRLTVNEIVDAAGWKHLEKLVDQRYLRAATPDEVQSAVPLESSKATRNKPKR